MVHHRANAPIKPTPLIGPWVCNVCNAKFTEISAHIQHMGAHALQYPSSCQLCLARYKDANQLASHVCAANNKTQRVSAPIKVSNNNAINEQVQKQNTQLPEKIKTTVITTCNNNLSKSVVPGPSSELSPLNSDDGRDEEDIFEAAQNPLRIRTSSIESNNNLSGTTDFLVTDPWQACSAIIEEEMGVGNITSGPKQDENPERRPTSSTKMQSVDEIISDLVMIPERNTKRGSFSQRRGRQTQARASVQRRSSKDAPSTSSSFNNSTDTNSPVIVAPTSNALMDLGVDENMELETAIASQHGIAYQPGEPHAPLDTSFYPNLVCASCQLKFAEYHSWENHLIQHINNGPPPMVPLTRLMFTECEAIDEFENFEVEEMETESVHVPIAETSTSPNEQKKEGLKLTLCRSDGKYVLKKSSIEGDVVPSSSQSNLNSSVVESVAIETFVDEPLTLPDLPELAIDEGNELQSLTVSDKDNASTSKPRIMGLKSAMISLLSETRKVLPGNNERKNSCENPRDVPQPPLAATTTDGKNSMTSPPTTTETVDEQSISETKNDSSESEQSPGNPVVEAQTRKPAETVIRGVTHDSSSSTEKLNLKANADLKSKASNNVPSNLSSTMTAESGSREEELEQRETPEQRVSGESAEVRNDEIDSDKEKMPIPENNRLELHAGGNNDFDDDNALVIDTGGVDEAEPVVKRRESDVSDKTELIKKRQSVESEGATSDKNDDNKSSHSQDGNEDFRCQVCHKMFSNDEEVNTHFSSEHFRPVVGDSILEPPSPFPSHIVTVEGHSSIFDDEVEESEPVQVEVETQLTEYPGATLSALLLRRNSADEGEVRDPGYPQGVVRAPSHQYLAHQQRHPIPIGGRGLPAPRMHGHPPPPGMRPGPPSSHLQQIHRPPPFSTALRQALLNNGQSQGPPQLRPMPGIQLRGAPHLPGRPPLHRGPPPVQHILPQPRNPQSLLRQPLEVSSQFSEGFAELSSKVIALDSDINLMDSLQKREANPLVRQQYYDKKNELLHARQMIIKRMEGVQKQNELQLLRQHQLDIQSAQHQQLRQQQLIQSRSHAQAGPHNIHGHPVFNENGKRPAVTISETPSNLANLAKQPRIDDQMSRLQNGLIIRPVIPQTSPSPTGHPHPPQTVEVGMHSGGSTGSRHSSGSNSPAIPSPGAQHRQSQIGATLTPASPLPLTLSPPDNPNLSPISDNSQSPRGSPRINVGSLVQNVMNTCIPGASAQSNFVSPKPPAQRQAVNTKERIVTVPHSERPDRPPTVDLTDDDILTHNAQMRATGRGIVTQDQIQIHEAAMQQRRNAMPIPGTSQFTIRPIHNAQRSVPAQPQRQFLCSPCNLPFNTIEEVNNHSVRVHGHRPQSQAQSYRAPQPNQVIRRASPGAMPQIRPNPTTIHHGAPQPCPGPSVSRERMPTQPSTRQHENNQSRQIIMVEDSKQLVIPIIDIEKLDDAKMNSLRELGVMEFIPVESMRRLGIPIMKFEPNMRLGHFPHDSAITIGSSYQIMSPDTRQPQPPTLRRASPASIPHSSHAPTQPSHHPNPPVVISPPMGAIYTERPCQDRNCQEAIRRPSPTSVIHPNLAHSNNQIRPIHPNHPLNRQYPQRSAHDSFLGGSANQFGGSR